jgi:hypothetical protein
MAENKTKATAVSVEAYIEAISDDTRRKDCKALSKLMANATKHKAVMWGTSIVGSGSYHYKYDSGREGDSCLVGFSSRKGDISIYLTASFPGREDLLARLGKYKLAKACLYVRALSDIDAKVLEQLVAGSAEARRLHASTRDND